MLFRLTVNNFNNFPECRIFSIYLHFILPFINSPKRYVLIKKISGIIFSKKIIVVGCCIATIKWQQSKNYITLKLKHGGGCHPGGLLHIVIENNNTQRAHYILDKIFGSSCSILFNLQSTVGTDSSVTLSLPIWEQIILLSCLSL